jgi:O-antigen ligase
LNGTKNLYMTSRLLRLSRAATLITLVVMAWQVNLPLDLPQFDTTSLPLSHLAPAMRLGEITALIAIATYAASGWPNLSSLRSGWRRIVALALIGLIVFAALSIAWSPHRGLAAMQVLHLAVWIAFTWLIACAAWPPAAMAYAFLAGLLLNSLAGFIQISWQPLVQITPQNSGISVVFNNAQHLLRVYGLSPHPNILGGYLAVGVILTMGLIIRQQHTKRAWLIAAWGLIWITLLLTFSRSAWLAAIGGGAVAVILLRRGHPLTRSAIKPLALVSGVGLIAVLIFGVLFQPFLVNRFDVMTTTYEVQAITQRVDTALFAWQIFAAHPLTGVGLSQSIVVMRDLAGMPIDWVHNVPLLIASELGVGGSVLIGLVVIAIGAIGVQRWRARSISMWQALVGGGLIALVIVMQFDHYVWTMPQGGLLCAWLVGWWLRTDHSTAS